MNRILSFCLLASLCTAMLSCSESGGDTPAPVASSAKAITSFKLNTMFSGLTTPVAATIDEATKKVGVAVAIDITNLHSASAVVVLSAKATIQPDPTLEHDYRTPVTYTVTAEDGSTAAYVVEAARATITITSVTGTFEPGTFMEINGSNFANCSCGSDIYFQEGSSAEIKLPPDIANASSTTKLNVKIPTDMELGTYKLKVKVVVSTVLGITTYEGAYANTLKVDFTDKSTKLTSHILSKTTNNSVAPPLTTYSILVRGRFLGNTSLAQLSSAKVYLVQVADPTKRVALNGGSYGGSSKFTYFSLNATVPALSMPSPSTGNKFYVEVEYGGMTTRYAEQITYPW